MKIEEFSCKRENLTIRGHIFREKEGVLPAVILCHPFLASEKACKNYAEILAKQGFAAFTFDFCGGGAHSKSDGKTEDMTLFTETEDLFAVMDHVQSLPNIDKNRLTLMGQSMGGAVCAIAAKKRRDDVEKLVMFYPALSIPDDARAGNMIMFRFDPENIPELIAKFPVKLGGNYAKSVINYDIYEAISGFEKPVLLLHGTNDRIVDISYSERAKNCYPNIVYRAIEGADHGFRGRSDKEAVEILCDFMKNDVQ